MSSSVNPPLSLGATATGTDARHHHTPTPSTSSLLAPALCPPSPSVTTASVSTADWPSTPTLTTVADISAPQTPVHNHAIATATARLQLLGSGSALGQAGSTTGSNTGSNTGSTGHQSQPPQTIPHQPTEQLKRNWLNAWINNQQQQPEQGQQQAQSDSNQAPSRTTSPHPSHSGSITQADSFSQYGADNTSQPTTSCNLVGAVQQQDVFAPGRPDPIPHVSHLHLHDDQDPTTPTLASMRDKYHPVPHSPMPCVNESGEDQHQD